MVLSYHGSNYYAANYYNNRFYYPQTAEITPPVTGTGGGGAYYRDDIEHRKNLIKPNNEALVFLMLF